MADPRLEPFALPVSGLAPLLQVFHMAASLRFYRYLLGFQVVGAAGQGDALDWVLLRLHQVELMLNTAYEQDQRPSAPDPTRLAAHADIGLYFACSDVEALYQYLSAQGLPVETPSIAPYGMKQLYLDDPDGYQLCFQWPTTSQTNQ